MSTAPISLPQDDSDPDRYLREREIAAQRRDYRWLHTPGLPPTCDGIPPGEVFTRRKSNDIHADLAGSLLTTVAGVAGWLRRGPHRLSHYDALYRFERAPAVQRTWTRDREFARQRMNGVNPFLITSISELPDHFPVTDATVAGVLPDGVSIARLLDERRLFVCDWKDIAGAPIVPGRFQVAPIALFWLDERRTLQPLAIQLGQSPADAPVIFTPADPYWVWLMARSYVASADGTYHELVAHLTRTHLVMEAVWIACRRTMAPQHPVQELLLPHFTGTIEINDDALTKLIAPGGPIDVSIAVGADGGLWLCEQEYRRWRFDHWHPERDLERRGVLDPEVLPGYYYRDDALRLHRLIAEHVERVLRAFYPDDTDVAADPELQAWASELVRPDGGAMRGTPVDEQGRLGRVDDLIDLITQVVYTVSVEHAAVNNGQWDQFGYIPNTPGAMYIPAPTTKHSVDESRLAYAMPGLKQAAEQMALAHLLSLPTPTPLGTHPEPYFASSAPAQRSVDIFRAGLDDARRAIDERNAELAPTERYTYLRPTDVGRSIAI